MPPQPNNTGSSPQGMDNSNTTVYHEKLNGECQNKSTSIQMSLKNTILTGTTTTTQTTHQKASQVDGTKTTPPPPLRKPMSMGGTQTSPPKDKPHRQVGQGQTDHNQEGQPANAAASQGKKTKKSTTEACHLVLDHLQDHQLVQEMTSHQETLGYWQTYNSVYSMQANIHTGEGNAHTIIIVQHVKIMTMLHTCVGFTDKPANNQGQQGQRSPQICIYTVEALNTVHLTAKGDLGTIGNNHMIHLNP